MIPSDRSVRAAITQVATEWFIANRSGSLTIDERKAFLAWLKQSPVHVEEYLSIASIERVLPDAAELPPLSLDALIASARAEQTSGVANMNSAASRSAQRQPPTLPTPAIRRMGWVLASFATVSAVVVFAAWFLRSTPESAPMTYSTARGSIGAWTLADGSVLRLDTDSEVRVRFASAERLLELDHGRVAVKVAHDLRRPLRVRSGDIDVVAVGTEFEVFCWPGATSAFTTGVSVMSGIVQVSARSPAPSGGTRSIRTLRLGPGQEARIAGGVMPEVATRSNAREATAWMDGKIVFDRRALGDVTDEFNRYNATQFEIDDVAL